MNPLHNRQPGATMADMKRMRHTTSFLLALILPLLLMSGLRAENPEIDADAGERGEFILFDEGRVQYPGAYRDPIDDIADPNDTQEAEAQPAPVYNLPQQVCPLDVERDTFRLANAQKRETLISGFDASSPRVVIFTRSRNHTSPLLMGGAVHLHRTVFNSHLQIWEADISLGDGFLCGGRVWRVQQDDGLTRDISILGIGPGVVLLSVGERLAYLRPAGTPPVEFRIIWDTGIDVEFHQGGSDSPPPADTKAGPARPVTAPKPSMPGGAPQRAPQRPVRPTAN